ncbi:aldehyde oxidase GLOX1-like [Papaver somniferum]|uniref:aldehyde oxidase GLOX1-like n=1 Tax=Papaver somniferum TaxID=3469 RepID=UPI000E7058BC|nr:aldehyde oxidase GLOX1-like [Papaver somniferum]
MEAKYVVVFSALIFSLFNLGETATTGSWKLLKKSIGISAMHTQLLPNDRVIMFDRTDFGQSKILLPEEKCSELATLGNTDCTAHSVELNLLDRKVRPLTVLTDTWCSSGSLAPDGMLLQSGGNWNGERAVRSVRPCANCDWMEDQKGLVVPRWYASNQILPNGKVIVVGGRGQFSYEFIPKSSLPSDSKVFALPFLLETSDVAENNLYPFTHLSPDGNLFIFANTKSILFDYVNDRVVRNDYPVMPGGVSRNYPSTGSSVLLPLKLGLSNSTIDTPDAEVFICGGAPLTSYLTAIRGTFLPAAKSCGRLMITAAQPQWQMEEMPMERAMGDMLLLPTGDVLLINGAKKGAAGWYLGREPVLNPVLYQPESGKFEVMQPSKTPRMYHSTAILIADGRVLVGGSNPNSNYNFTEMFPTELSVEVFSPPYLSSGSRPQINLAKLKTEISYKKPISIGFVSKNNEVIENVSVTMVAPSFNTHSFSMNQRMLVLNINQVRQVTSTYHVIDCFSPETPNIAPPGYYLLFVVQNGVPSRGRWVHIS